MDAERRAYIAGLPTVVVCAGHPACLLTDNAAVENANAGCPLCKRIAIHPDRSETVYRLPAN